MAKRNLTSGKKIKFKPAGKEAQPKICAVQFIKGREKNLIELSHIEKNSMPKEIEQGMSIQVYNGGIEQERA